MKVTEEKLKKIQEMLNDGKTRADIAIEIDVTENTVNAWISRYKLDYKDPYTRASVMNLLRVQQMLNANISRKEIAETIGVHVTSINAWIRQYHMKDPNAGSGHGVVSEEKINLVKALLSEGRSKRYIADTIGVSQKTIYGWIYKYELEKKTE